MSMRLRAAVMSIALALGACSGDEAEEPQRTERPSQSASPAPPPDAGTQAGHGADPRRVRVPREDSTPPKATITLQTANGAALAEASQPPGRPEDAVIELREPLLRGVSAGKDLDGGVARVRVSIEELITCRAPGGSDLERRRTRYFPPPQIERIRSNPGTPLVTEDSRTLTLRLGGDSCGSAPRVAVEGELWGEATNGSGLEAVTPHLHFKWSR